MSNYVDPNEEVEKWKDKFYEKIKNLHGKDLGNFIEKNADRILKKYNIKCKVVDTIKRDKQELVKV